MRWPQESAITRRDDHLARTRRLSLWIASGATAASFSLAAALGFALPGHSVSTGSQPAGSHTSSGSGAGSQPGTGSGSGGGASGGSGGQVAPPQQPPSNPVAPPMVSSGGS